MTQLPGLFIQISKVLGRKRPPSLKTVGREYLSDLSILSTPKLEMRRNLWRPGSFKGLRAGGNSEKVLICKYQMSYVNPFGS